MNVRAVLVAGAVMIGAVGCGSVDQPQPADPPQATPPAPQVAPDGQTDVVRPEDLERRRRAPQVAPDGVSDAVPVDPERFPDQPAR